MNKKICDICEKEMSFFERLISDDWLFNGEKKDICKRCKCKILNFISEEQRKNKEMKKRKK